MKIAVPPARDGDESDVGADETRHSRPTLGEVHCETDAPIPPYGDDDCDGDDGADKTARSQTSRARFFLAIGVVLEVCATLWAFQQAVATGALDGVADCYYGGRLAKLFTSSRVAAECAGPIDADAFYSFTSRLNYSLSGRPSSWEEYLVCDYHIDAPTESNDFGKKCACSNDNQEREIEPCLWIALSGPSNDTCYAYHVYTNINDGAITTINEKIFSLFDCWSKNPEGTVELTITSFAVALSSQFLEALVGFMYWKYTAKVTAPTLVTSILEALGVLAVSWVLFEIVDFNSEYPSALTVVLVWVARTIAAIVVIGALAEVMAECSDRAARRLPYLGTLGNGLIWLGAASLEVVVTMYLVAAGTGNRDADFLAGEVAGLLAVELLGVVAMWIARVLWTRAKLLKSVIRIQEALRKHASET